MSGFQNTHPARTFPDYYTRVLEQSFFTLLSHLLFASFIGYRERVIERLYMMSSQKTSVAERLSIQALCTQPENNREDSSMTALPSPSTMGSSSFKSMAGYSNTGEQHQQQQHQNYDEYQLSMSACSSSTTTYTSADEDDTMSFTSGLSIDDPDVRLAAEALGDLRYGIVQLFQHGQVLLSCCPYFILYSDTNFMIEK
ncbi:hypothetical protein V1511DRAFT_171228 [Dipodascopsis uninucleata]